MLFLTGDPEEALAKLGPEPLEKELGIKFADYTGLANGQLTFAVTAPKRLAIYPEVPTLIESGVTGVEASSWSGVLAPLGTPPEIIARLHAETVAALRSPEVADKLKLMAAEPKITTPEEFGAFVASEYQRIGTIMRAAHIAPQ